MSALLNKIDCHSLPVNDLNEAIVFYVSLGHELIWKGESAAGLKFPNTDAELVVHLDDRPIETDFLVDSVPEAIARFKEAGGKLLKPPFEIQIGLCAVLEDPWKNPIVILDMSKGKLEVDSDRNVKM